MTDVKTRMKFVFNIMVFHKNEQSVKQNIFAGQRYLKGVLFCNKLFNRKLFIYPFLQMDIGQVTR